MPKLTVSYSKVLLNLIRSRANLPIDGIEVGPWFTPREIEEYESELPGWPFHFHASNLISHLRYRPGTRRRLQQYLSCTTNEWLSVHIELLPLPVYLFSARLGIHLPPPDADRALRKYLQALEKVKEEITIPIILENLPLQPVEKYFYAANPSLISDILDSSGCGFLLDLAHARLAAAYQGWTVDEYLRQLPLQQVKQIHVSGNRMVEGHLDDAHEAMGEEDYAILEWTLGNCQPTMVTLEYFREEGALQEQIWRIRDILGH